MTAPSPTPRVTPTGNMLENGYQSLITLAVDTNIDIWEKTATPPGYDGGEPINITTMHNQNVITKDLNALFEVTDLTIVAAYARLTYTQLLSVINVNTTVTFWFPDGGSWCAFGGVRSAIPSANERGSQPEMTVVIAITNVDPATGAEELPVTSSGVGSL